MKINFFCPLLGTSGFSNHGRGLVNAVASLGHDVFLSTPLPNEWLRLVNDAELKMIQVNKFDRNAPTVAISQPPFWPMIFGEGVTQLYPFVIWEGDRVPLSWMPFLVDSRIKALLVPSVHVKMAIEKTWKEYEDVGDLPPIVVISHGFDPEVFRPETLKRDSEDFVFICNAGWAKGMSDRKGVQFLLRAFCEEFTSQDKVKLLVKINPAYVPPNWDIQAELDKIGVNRANKAKIAFSIDVAEPKDIARLYNQSDVFVCPQMADAFNLGGLEAMACGLGTIQTGFGGQTDYVNEKNGWLLPYSLVPAPVADFGDILYEGVKWALPDEKELKRLLRYISEHPEEAKEKGKEALADSARWTWKSSAETLCQLFLSK